MRRPYANRPHIRNVTKFNPKTHHRHSIRLPN